MTTSLSKYAINQFLVMSENRPSVMNEVLADALPRILHVTAGLSAFDDVRAAVVAASAAWDAGEIVLSTAEAMGPSTTLAFEDKMQSLRRPPTTESPSPMAVWDNTLRIKMSVRGAIYKKLMPHGRKTLTHGSREAQLDAGEQLAQKLAAQTSDPELVALGALVDTFYTEARALRAAQITAKAKLEQARLAQDALRIRAGRALYAVIGMAMVVFNETPEKVDTLFDVNLLRTSNTKKPTAPKETTWDPATRTLITPELPKEATRLEAWRSAPGAMPERLAVQPGKGKSIRIPATILFTPGTLYQLWLQAANCRGSSAPGPVQSWLAE